MEKLQDKLMEIATSAPEGNLGARLKEMRNLCGLSQENVATKMGVALVTISKIERKQDIGFNQLRHYVGALGASLRIEARFDRNSGIASRLSSLFEYDDVSEAQFLLPIFEDTPIREDRDLVFSIRPQYSEKILEGKKTVELRRRFSEKIRSGTLVYVYSTSPTKGIDGVATIEDVKKLPTKTLWEKYSDVAFIQKDDFDNYFAGLENGYAIELSNVARLQSPMSLDELRKHFDFEPPQSYAYAKPVLREILRHERTFISN